MPGGEFAHGGGRVVGEANGDAKKALLVQNEGGNLLTPTLEIERRLDHSIVIIYFYFPDIDSRRWACATMLQERNCGPIALDINTVVLIGAGRLCRVAQGQNSFIQL